MNFRCIGLDSVTMFSLKSLFINFFFLNTPLAVAVLSCQDFQSWPEGGELMQMSSPPLLAAHNDWFKEHFNPEDESELNIASQKPLQCSMSGGRMPSK